MLRAMFAVKAAFGSAAIIGMCTGLEVQAKEEEVAEGTDKNKMLLAAAGVAVAAGVGVYLMQTVCAAHSELVAQALSNVSISFCEDSPPSAFLTGLAIDQCGFRLRQAPRLHRCGQGARQSRASEAGDHHCHRGGHPWLRHRCERQRLLE